jgi:hypothetical protein
LRKVPKNLYVTPSRRAEHGGGGRRGVLRMTDRPFGGTLRKGLLFTDYVGKKRALSPLHISALGYKTPMLKHTHNIYTTSRWKLQVFFAPNAQNFFPYSGRLHNFCPSNRHPLPVTFHPQIPV